MEKFIYDQSNGLWYELQGDYYIPCLKLPEEEQIEIGIWGQRHLEYIKENRLLLGVSNFPHNVNSRWYPSPPPKKPPFWHYAKRVVFQLLWMGFEVLISKGAVGLVPMEMGPFLPLKKWGRGIYPKTGEVGFLAGYSHKSVISSGLIFITLRS